MPDLEAADVEPVLKAFADRFSALHERIIFRREHFYADESVDPKLGRYNPDGTPHPANPYVDVSRYQSDAPRRLAQRLVARLTENPITVEVDHPLESRKKDANELTLILNAWVQDIQERTDTVWQQAAGYHQARDAYAVLHTRLAADLWKPQARKYSNDPGPDFEEAGEDDEDYDEPSDEEGENEGSPDSDEDDNLRTVRNSHASDNIATRNRKLKGKYREKGDALVARQERLRAKEGSPWHAELIDPLNFYYEFDRTGARGLARAAVVYEVSPDVYEAALKSGDVASPTELLGLSPAPGREAGPSDRAAHNTPSSGDYHKRVRVVQYWTREYWCEYVETSIGDSVHAQMKKGGRTPCGIVPFWIIWANRTYHPDPLWDAEPYLEGVFRQKPFWDRQVTLAAAITELSAEPLLMKRRRDATQTPLLPTGTPADMAPDSAGAAEVEPGTELQQVQIALDPGLGQFLEFVRAEMRESEPPVGAAEIGSATSPWTARIMQTESNVGPNVLMDNLTKAVKAMVALWMDWHIANPDEALVAYAREQTTGKRRRNRVLRIDPREVDLEEFDAEVAINPVSGVEQVTMTQLQKELLEAGLITPEEFYRVGMNKPNAHDYYVEVEVQNIARPYVQTYVRSKIASIMGSRYLQGVDGEIISAGSGAAVSPQEVLQANGWTPAPQANPPAPAGGGVGAPSPVDQSMVDMGAPQPIDVPGTMPMAAGGGMV